MIAFIIIPVSCGIGYVKPELFEWIKLFEFKFEIMKPYGIAYAIFALLFLIFGLIYVSLRIT